LGIYTGIPAARLKKTAGRNKVKAGRLFCAEFSPKPRENSWSWKSY